MNTIVIDGPLWFAAALIVCVVHVENYAQRTAEDVPGAQIARTRRFMERADVDEAGVLR